jgi:hypothetical protein
MFTIPIINFGVKRALVHKFKWVFIALLAPEYVLFSALDQWYNARALCRELKNIGTDDVVQQSEEPQYENDGKSQFPSNEESQSDNDESSFIREALHKNSNGDYDAEEIYTNAGIENLLRPTIVIPTGSETKDWTGITMTSAFFIIMEGFAYRHGQSFDIPDSELKFPNLILTPAGFLQLARRKILHPGLLDEKTIADRSKANSLAKLLMCAQAFWVVINVIARKANGLPNTLIDLNVVVHVVITIFVYALWWNKPLAVQNPVILNPVTKSDEELDYRIPQFSELFKYSYNASPNFPFHGLIALHHNISLLHEADGPLQHARIWEWSARQKWLIKGTHPRWHWLFNLYSFGSYRLGGRRDIEEHHEKYAGMIGYGIKLPGG